MDYITRTKLMRVLRFLRPQPTQLPLSVREILGDTSAASLVDQFNRLYYESGSWSNLQWRGVQILKNPCDLWMMLELMQTVRPSVLIETGTHEGGSALYFAELTKLLGHTCSVITVDYNPKFGYSPEEYGIFPIVGYSTDSGVVDKVRRTLRTLLDRSPGPVMVTLDSDHSEENVTKEIQLYKLFVTVNSFLIVEDTNVNGHPVLPQHGPGPWEAVQRFLIETDEFEGDVSCQRHLLTFCPNGYLKRVKEPAPIKPGRFV